jgi:multidrug efflux pump subunit AcrB
MTEKWQRGVQYHEEETRFTVMMKENLRKNIAYLRELRVPNGSNRLIQLKHVARFKTSQAPSSYIHYNNERSVTIQANVDESIVMPETASGMVISHFNLAQDYPGMRFIEEGAAKKKRESLNKSSQTFLIAIVGIYFLLVLLFNSLLQPLLVLAAIPFGLTGVILIFGIHGEPMSFMAMLGIIGLSGVVVNDSLVLVDHLNRQLRDNEQKKENERESFRAVIARGSADRLRPIIMTTLTTAAGLLPLAYGIGGVDPGTAPMALALGWGLILATPLTLMLVPCLYGISHDVKKVFSRKKNRQS